MRRNQHILVVDDHAGVRSATQEILMIMGFKTSEAANGTHALTKLNSGLKPDLILCDVNTPLMGGFDFYAEVKKCFPQIPIIIMTGTQPLDVMDDFESKNIKDFLFKPLRPQTLKAMIERLLEPILPQAKSSS